MPCHLGHVELVASCCLQRAWIAQRAACRDEKQLCEPWQGKAGSNGHWHCSDWALQSSSSVLLSSSGNWCWEEFACGWRCSLFWAELSKRTAECSDSGRADGLGSEFFPIPGWTACLYYLLSILLFSLGICSSCFCMKWVWLHWGLRQKLCCYPCPHFRQDRFKRKQKSIC